MSFNSRTTDDSFKWSLLNTRRHLDVRVTPNTVVEGQFMPRLEAFTRGAADLPNQSRENTATDSWMVLHFTNTWIAK